MKNLTKDDFHQLVNRKRPLIGVAQSKGINRADLEADVAAFLAQGGTVERVATTFCAPRWRNAPPKGADEAPPFRPVFRGKVVSAEQLHEALDITEPRLRWLQAKHDFPRAMRSSGKGTRYGWIGWSADELNRWLARHPALTGELVKTPAETPESSKISAPCYTRR